MFQSLPAVTEEELTAASQAWLFGRANAPLPAIKKCPV